MKILFIDLDGTLIETITGSTFPQGVWDFKFRFDVLDTIKSISPALVAIISNQGGIALGHVNEAHFRTKLDYIKSAISEYTGCLVVAKYCASNDKSRLSRKPNPGFLIDIANEFNVQPQDCLMVGDASGKPGDYSDSDKQTAINFGCPYMDVNDFINERNNISGNSSNC